MGDSGEGLIDAEARIQERMEEMQLERESKQRPSGQDPERVQALESLRLARTELEQQLNTTTHERRRAQLQQAIAEVLAYTEALIEANAPRLGHTDPALIIPGETVVLPDLAVSPAPEASPPPPEPTAAAGGDSAAPTEVDPAPPAFVPVATTPPAPVPAPVPSPTVAPAVADATLSRCKCNN